MNLQAIADLTIPNTPKTEQVAPATPAPEATRAPKPAEPVSAGEYAEDQAEEPDREQVEQVLDGVNSFLHSGGSHIQFALHEKAQRMMVQIIDNETQEVVRTFPPKELLDLAARIGEMVGTLIDQTG